MENVISTILPIVSSIITAVAAWVIWRVRFSEKTQERKTDQLFEIAEQYIKDCGDAKSKYEEILQLHGVWTSERVEWLADKEKKELEIASLRAEIAELRSTITQMSREKYANHSDV